MGFNHLVAAAPSVQAISRKRARCNEMEQSREGSREMKVVNQISVLRSLSIYIGAWAVRLTFSSELSAPLAMFYRLTPPVTRRSYFNSLDIFYKIIPIPEAWRRWARGPKEIRAIPEAADRYGDLYTVHTYRRVVLSHVDLKRGDGSKRRLGVTSLYKDGKMSLGLSSAKGHKTILCRISSRTFRARDTSGRVVTWFRDTPTQSTPVH
ncbi:hypothetical protein J6590_033804 [Homalodisca vitripennis]|nr:hypothetical protein J6590_033804 [Homalodisca vitripennis]